MMDEAKAGPKGGPGVWKGTVVLPTTQDGTKQGAGVRQSDPPPEPVVAGETQAPPDAWMPREDRAEAESKPKGGPGVWKGPGAPHSTEEGAKQEGDARQGDRPPKPVVTDETQSTPDVQMSRGEKWAPRPKVATGAGIGGPLSTVLAWSVGLAGLELPPEVAVAMSALIIFLVGYLTPERSSDTGQ